MAKQPSIILAAAAALVTRREWVQEYTPLISVAITKRNETPFVRTAAYFLGLMSNLFSMFSSSPETSAAV
eukprot:8560477-Prorocentrum_lima.AAC.1